MFKLKKNTSILIVEDEFIIAEDIRQICLNNGYGTVEISSKPEEVLFKVSSLKPDMILMDICLNSDLDGVDLCSQIRSISTVPILFITAHADSDTISRLKVYKPDGIIVKPYTDLGLIANIEIILHNVSKSRDAMRELMTTFFD
tara:strand:+ start:52 stop:483 length:432 start_codon:yes stop_codon:yes gene_type:complete